MKIPKWLSICFLIVLGVFALNAFLQIISLILLITNYGLARNGYAFGYVIGIGVASWLIYKGIKWNIVNIKSRCKNESSRTC